MLQKRKQLLENEETSELLSTLLTSHPEEVEEALSERNLYDDHGLVIIGNRKDQPIFS